MKFFLTSFNRALTPSTGKQQELWNNPGREIVLGKIHFSIWTLSLYCSRKPRARDGAALGLGSVANRRKRAGNKAVHQLLVHTTLLIVIKHLSVAPDFPFDESFSHRTDLRGCWVHLLEFSRVRKKSKISFGPMHWFPNLLQVLPPGSCINWR